MKSQPVRTLTLRKINVIPTYCIRCYEVCLTKKTLENSLLLEYGGGLQSSNRCLRKTNRFKRISLREKLKNSLKNFIKGASVSYVERPLGKEILVKVGSASKSFPEVKPLSLIRVKSSFSCRTSVYSVGIVLDTANELRNNGTEIYFRYSGEKEQRGAKRNSPSADSVDLTSLCYFEVKYRLTSSTPRI